MTAKFVQWLYTRLVPPNTILPLTGPNGFTWATEAFPYTVPAGYWLGIVDVALDSKYTDGGPNPIASYFVIDNVLALPDNVGSRHFRIPLVIPENITLSASFINNDYNQQHMNAQVTGILVPKVAGQTYQDAFAYLAQRQETTIQIPEIVVPPPQITVNVPPPEVTVNPQINITPQDVSWNLSGSLTATTSSSG